MFLFMFFVRKAGSLTNYLYFKQSSRKPCRKNSAVSPTLLTLYDEIPQR